MSIDIEDQIRFFLKGEFFDCEGVFEVFRSGDSGGFFAKNDGSSVWIEFALDAVSDSRDRYSRFFHACHEVLGGFVCSYRFKKVSCRSIDGTAESRSDREESGDKRRYEVFSGSCRDDSIRCARYGRSVICKQYDDRVDEVECVLRKISFEPEGSEYPCNTALFNECSNGSSVQEEIFRSFVGYRRSENRLFSFLEHREFLLDSCGFRIGRDNGFSDVFTIHFPDERSEVSVALRHKCSRFLECSVFVACGFLRGICLGSCVSELDFCREFFRE